MRQDEAQGAGTTLADFVAGTAWADVAAQNHEAKRSILNFFATALGSANDPAVSGALRTLLPFSGAATSAVIGRPERLDAMGAAFVNAISANLLDFDDTHLDTIIHPAAPVAAPVLALAQARGFSGQAVLVAFILGVEVECRVGNAVSPGHYARGWHITSTCGVFGAAAACAWLLGFRQARPQMRSELRPASPRGSSKIFRARPRMSVSAMRRATACLRHCSRLKAIPHRRGPSKGRSAGPAPWATSRISGA